MRPIGRTLAFAAAILVACAAPARAQDPSVPPTVLAPAQGAEVAAGAGVTFEVSSDVPDDEFLWVRVSRSDAPVEACGTIAGDVAQVSLEPTAVPGVYAGTPTLFDLYDFWLNRPGIYFWQAYRIYYGGGADGCVEAPLRAFSVMGVRPIEIGPQPLEPADGAQLAAGPVSFRAAALAADADQYLWLHVSRSPQVVANGLIGDDAELEALTRTADPAVWSALPAYFDHSTFWMNTPGQYFWQPYRISSFGDPDGFVEGPVRSFTLTAAPTPTPTPEPVTIRGDEAFTKGTANDLYLACTKLDLHLVDVLPAGDRVRVTGVADLRLRGATVRILLDGRRVGSAVVGEKGAFAATVRAPVQARRAKARYQAVSGTARSQNLKLVRRMVAAKLTRSGDRLTLTGRITRPFARRPARIRIQRYVACGRLQAVRVATFRPTATGRFRVTFPVPAASARALMFRARTSVATRPGGAATSPTYTLPRAIDLG